MQSLFQKSCKKITRGFTLVETLVAITVLLVVIIGPMTIAQKGMQNAYYAGDQTTAVYLAQEAIEAVQKLRDDVALQNFQDYKTDGNDHDGDTRSWYTSLNGNCKDSDGCDVDFQSGGPVFSRDCTSSSNCLLKVSTAWPPTGVRVYGYNAAWLTNSIYTRSIKVGAYVDGGYPVTVTVRWMANIFGNPTNNARSVVLQTYIYDHYKRYE
jgi:prepilin-type N-terminal cleavage/methylation domain-containing protein